MSRKGVYALLIASAVAGVFAFISTGSFIAGWYNKYQTEKDIDSLRQKSYSITIQADSIKNILNISPDDSIAQKTLDSLTREKVSIDSIIPAIILNYDST